MNRKIRELMIVLKSDSRRAGVLGLLIVTLFVLAVRAVWFRGPTSAQAAARQAAAQSSSEAVAKGVSAAAVVGQRRRGPIVVLEAPAEAVRDLFLLDPARFPPPVNSEAAVPVGPKSIAGIADDPEAAARRARLDLEVRTAQDAERLRLRGTLMGNSPTAVIENPLDRRSVVLTPGQLVAGFTLVEVRAGSVLLERDGVRVELQRFQSER